MDILISGKLVQKDYRRATEHLQQTQAQRDPQGQETVRRYPHAEDKVTGITGLHQDEANHRQLPALNSIAAHPGVV